MSTRLSRKNRTNEELGILSQGGLLDLFDNESKFWFRLNDKEFDFLCEETSDDEVMLLFGHPEEKMSFSEKRAMLTRLKELTDKYESRTS